MTFDSAATWPIASRGEAPRKTRERATDAPIKQLGAMHARQPQHTRCTLYTRSDQSVNSAADKRERASTYIAQRARVYMWDAICKSRGPDAPAAREFAPQFSHLVMVDIWGNRIEGIEIYGLSLLWSGWCWLGFLNCLIRTRQELNGSEVCHVGVQQNKKIIIHRTSSLY